MPRGAKPTINLVVKQLGQFVRMEVTWPEGGCRRGRGTWKGRGGVVASLGSQVEGCGHTAEQ